MKLLLLRCPICTEPLKPADQDVIFPCASCHTPILLNEKGIQTAEIKYAAPRNNEVTEWLPFWLAHGRVNITTRATQGTNRRALAASQAMWQQPRTIYIPAWDIPVPHARKLGQEFIESQHQLIPRDTPLTSAQNPLFTAANITPTDAFKLLELIVLTIEAERQDWLKSLEFTLDFPAPTLWIIPATKGRRGLKLLAQTR